jgi:hypothetical protein
MPRLIVTLTSFPARIKTVHIVIDSLFHQKLKPDMIVLYLGYDKFPNKNNDLPKELLEQTKRGLIIHWVKDIGCFTTLIPALNEFPDDIIINIDDDISYDNNFLSRLYRSYKKDPSSIHTNAAHRVLFDHEDMFLPYVEWVSPIDFYKKNYCYHIIDFLLQPRKFLKKVSCPSPSTNDLSTGTLKRETPSFQNFIISSLGTLYPPHCMHEDVKNIDLAFQLTPTNDDIWFWTQAIRKGTKVKITKTGFNRFKYIKNTQSAGLFNSNLNILDINNNKKLTPNDNQLQKVSDYYPDLMEKIKTEPLSHPSNAKCIYLFNFIPLLYTFYYNKKNIVMALFKVFPFLIIKLNESRHIKKVYLLGIIPLFKINYY